jgi:hypothetical protein
MLEIVRTNEGDEFLAYFPNYVRLYKLMKAKYESFVKRLSKILEDCRAKKHLTEDDLIRIARIPQERVLVKQMLEAEVSNAKEFIEKYGMDGYS